MESDEIINLILERLEKASSDARKYKEESKSYKTNIESMSLLGQELKSKIIILSSDLELYKEANETLRKQITNGEK